MRPSDAIQATFGSFVWKVIVLHLPGKWPGVQDSLWKSRLHVMGLDLGLIILFCYMVEFGWWCGLGSAAMQLSVMFVDATPSQCPRSLFPRSLLGLIQ
jgi:hypothetical protein